MRVDLFIFILSGIRIRTIKVFPHIIRFRILVSGVEVQRGLFDQLRTG